ncbi:MAG: septum site-determining protein MinD [Succinivibrionaceae bacterium]|nr:septum site-determining protein MinD [Succinivibrionaceae bacterium]MEE1340932.1 septum site-determining protein MinD [Succinivibrionaceae bacterium]
MAEEEIKQNDVEQTEEQQETLQEEKVEVEATKEEATKEEAPQKDDYSKGFNAKVIVVTSGKGGVGKTTSSAAISSGLAMLGHKTAVIDFDVGLRNLDLVMGCERRVVYDFVNVIKKEANLNMALIKDKNNPNLFIIPASQTRDKDALTKEGVARVFHELDDMGFEYIICDSPAGIETGALMALYFADIAVVTTNPEVSSVRDSDRIIGILDSKSRRAEYGLEPIKPYLLLTRYSPNRVEAQEMLSKDDVVDLLSIELIGVIPESQAVLKASNAGKPIIYDKESDAGQAYMDTVNRLLGQKIDFRFIDVPKKGFFKRLFGK